MASKLHCKQLLRSARTAWCVGLLLIAGNVQASVVDDNMQHTVAGSYGQERTAAAGGYGQEHAAGGYGQESAYGYGYAVSSDSVGSYGDGTLETAEHILDQLMAGPSRRLLQTEITIPADSSSSSMLSSMELDIIPAEVPADKAWDTRSLDSLSNAAEEFVSGAYSMQKPAAEYGGYQESGRPGAYGGYGAAGAYFDFRSGTVFQPESLILQPEQQQEAGTPPSIELPATSQDGVHLASIQQQPLQTHLAAPLLGGVTRGRGLPLATALPEKGLASKFTGQFNLPHLHLAAPLQHVATGSVGRRLSSVVYDGLLEPPVPRRMSNAEMAAMLRPKWYSRKLHMVSRA